MTRGPDYGLLVQLLGFVGTGVFTYYTYIEALEFIMWGWRVQVMFYPEYFY